MGPSKVRSNTVWLLGRVFCLFLFLLLQTGFRKWLGCEVFQKKSRSLALVFTSLSCTRSCFYQAERGYRRRAVNLWGTARQASLPFVSTDCLSRKKAAQEWISMRQGPKKIKSVQNLRTNTRDVAQLLEGLLGVHKTLGSVPGS